MSRFYTLFHYLFGLSAIPTPFFIFEVFYLFMPFYNFFLHGPRAQKPCHLVHVVFAVTLTAVPQVSRNGMSQA